MKIELELWHLISLVITIIGAFWTLGKLIAVQAKSQIDQQFRTLGEHMRVQAEHMKSQDESDRRLERQLMELKAELPRDYVRREDYAQAIATIMTKMDAMAMRVENHFLELMKGRDRE